jgi:hypothetical protein
MNNVLEKIDQACHTENPNQNLEALVYALSSQGFSRQEIFEIFYNVRLNSMYSQEWLLLEKLNNNHHPIDLILDRLCGYCNRKLILLPNEPFRDKKEWFQIPSAMLDFKRRNTNWMNKLFPVYQFC